MTRYWIRVLSTWVLLAMLLRFAAPSWESIAADGDLAFLPPNVPSLVGLRQLDAAFPGVSSRSQMVIILAREDGPMSGGDIALGLDVARRLHLYAARNEWEHLPVDAPLWNNETLSRSQQASLELVQDNLNQCIQIEEVLSEFLETGDRQLPRIYVAYELRGRLLKKLGKDADGERDLDLAKALGQQQVPAVDGAVPKWAKPLNDVWTWRDAAIGHKLSTKSEQARLIALQLDNDFTAVSNIAMLDGLEKLTQEIRQAHHETAEADLRIEISGSAAVGADMLRASSGGVRQTEWATIVLVVLILALVYRGPFLIAIPLISIALSLAISTSVLALLARDPAQPGSSGLGVFTTTRIFIVVLMFGAGTDFCLFFLARCREIMHSQPTPTRGHFQRVVGRAWRGVHDALFASAMTTIVGLSMMVLSSFEKFRFSGPVIAISLAITLAVCLTFTPALLSGIGQIAFWPSLRRPRPADDSEARDGIWNRFWFAVGTFVVRYPAPTLVGTIAVLVLPAMIGWSCLGWVTYNFANELSAGAPSRRGAELMSRFFPPHANSPVTLLVTRKAPFENEEKLSSASDTLAKALYLPGVEAVRSVNDPLGDYPPNRWMSLFSQDSWRRRVLSLHRVSRGKYLSSVSEYQGRLAKFDIVLKDSPFSLEAAETLSRIAGLVKSETSRADSPWYGAQFTTAGTAVGIADLRKVTQSDQSRIQILATLGVWVVLLFLVRHWGLATYLIFTVLLSYFSTLGLTYGVFSWWYGSDFDGLDWKVPLFLFVILVAVGQDYNVYLTSRILEEQQGRGALEGIRRALGVTGGIITSCGVVMAGTFIAMTTPEVMQWLGHRWPGLGLDTGTPVLRGITELGFALSLGVLLDTLVVRSLLVPAFFALRPRAAA